MTIMRFGIRRRVAAAVEAWRISGEQPYRCPHCGRLRVPLDGYLASNHPEAFCPGRPWSCD